MCVWSWRQKQYGNFLIFSSWWCSTECEFVLISCSSSLWFMDLSDCRFYMIRFVYCNDSIDLYWLDHLLLHLLACLGGWLMFSIAKRRWIWGTKQIFRSWEIKKYSPGYIYQVSNSYLSGVCVTNLLDGCVNWVSTHFLLQDL